MPIQWCSHPVAHSGTTKIACKPSHPKADRRFYTKLAMFMKESYGISNDELMIEKCILKIKVQADCQKSRQCRRISSIQIVQAMNILNHQILNLPKILRVVI